MSFHDHPATALLEDLKPNIIDLSLTRMYQLLDSLGNPQDHLPLTIHVAGTNGKGSTIAFLRAMLEAAGYRVHVYTSPHLVRFNERIRLAGSLITDDALQEALEEVRAINQNPTFFEATTAAAFLAFSRTPADVVILETGLGGRLDATNVINHPACSVITPISHDHMEFLGTTLPEIALEKAGIFKSGALVVIAPQPTAVLPILKNQAADLGCALTQYGKDWHIESNAKSFIFTHNDTQLCFPLPSLKGEHQLINAGTALATLYALQDRLPLSQKAMEQGIITATWPGRLQQLDLDTWPEGGEIWLDGAHNIGGSEILTTVIKNWQAIDAKPLYLIFGMLQRKSAQDFLRPLAPYISKLFAVSIEDVEDCYSPQSIVDIASTLGISSVKAKTSSTALLLIRQENPGRVLVCGSLYLVGNVLKKNDFFLE